MNNAIKSTLRAIIATSVANVTCQIIRNNVESETPLGVAQVKIATLAIGAFVFDRVYLVSEEPIGRLDVWSKRRVANVKKVMADEKRKQEAKDAYETDTWPVEAVVDVEADENPE